jgi:hypothetical protein
MKMALAQPKIPRQARERQKKVGHQKNTRRGGQFAKEKSKLVPHLIYLVV